MPDKIQVTENVLAALKDRYQFERRGEVQVKGRGSMVTHFLKAKRRASQGVITEQIQELDERLTEVKEP